jgi:hypothetical protein
MFCKRFFFVVMSAALVASVLLAARVPLVSGQDASSIKISLTPYEGNPILTVGEEGAWDADGVADPHVIFSGGMFHMLYLGRTGNLYSDVNSGVGYATSEDGLTWTKYEGNPIFVPDPSAAPDGLLNFTAMLDGETWVIYFSQLTESRAANSVFRATAPSPTGPWTVDPEPVLSAGTITDWDYGGPDVSSVLRTDEGYVLYYCPMQNVNADATTYNYPMGGFGRAVSPDGVHWTKYDDPATTDARHSMSDPVLSNNFNSTGWDKIYLAAPAVRYSENGWEMFYSGADYTWGYHIGYATSPDGITWTRYGDVPVVTAPDIAIGTGGSVVVLDDGTYYVYFFYTTQAAWVSPKYPEYIGIATGTVTRE